MIHHILGIVCCVRVQSFQIRFFGLSYIVIITVIFFIADIANKRSFEKVFNCRSVYCTLFILVKKTKKLTYRNSRYANTYW